MEKSSESEIPPKLMVAQEFRLVDSKGECRTRLYIDEEDRARLSMYDPQSKSERLSLGFDETNSPALHLYDQAGVLRATLDLDKDQDPGLALYDSQNDQARVRLIAITEGPSHLWFSDASSQQYVRIFTGDKTDGTGLVFHEQANRRVVLTIDEGTSRLLFCDNSQEGNDTERLVLEAGESRESQIFLRDSLGQTGITITMDQNGIPSVEMSHEGAASSVVVTMSDGGTPHVSFRNTGERKSGSLAPPESGKENGDEHFPG